MAIRTDDFDDLDDDVLDDVTPTNTEPPVTEPPVNNTNDDDLGGDPTPDPTGEPTQDDFIIELLKSRGIEDPSKIKFENESGEIEETPWDSLSVEDKLNILNSSGEQSDSEGLDEDEINLINAIRESKLTPAEYLQYMQQTSVEAYIQNAQSQNQTYSVDQYSDDELYVMDLITKSEDITEDEAMEALERAKSNEALFKKQIGALRNAYKRQEEESLNYDRLKREQEAQDEFNQFAEQIEDAILNFKSFSGGELDMSKEDMEDLYTFITGTDNAGNNWFNKALHDPNMVVQMAWFVLNGEKMIADINDYYQKRITEVSKTSYQKGLTDAGKKDTPTTVYKPKGNTPVSHQDLNDIDEEF